MNKLLKGFLWAIAIEATVVAVVFVCDRAAGTGWALPAAVMIGLPLLAVRFPEKQRSRR